MLHNLVKLYPIIPVILIIIAVCTAISAFRKYTNSVEAEGIITELKMNTAAITRSSDNSYMMYPVIEYDYDGTRYSFSANYATSSMRIGDRVKILIKKTDPSKAVIKQGLFVAPLIVGGLAIVFIIPYFVFKAIGL